MSAVSPSSMPSAAIPSRASFPFVLVTFVITWGVIGLYILAPERAAAWFGEIGGAHPLFFLATWAPGIAGMAGVMAHAGTRGLRPFLARLLMWRCPSVWWLVILAGIPLVFIAGSLIKGGPVLAPLCAGAPIGAVWGLWHQPAFYLAGVVFAEWSFLPCFVGNLVLAILVTPIFNAARGSLLLPVLFHWQLINPLWPEAQPWDTWILVALAAVIVWWRCEEMLGHDGTVTEVVPWASPAPRQAAG